MNWTQGQPGALTEHEVNLGHVHVIHEDDESLARGRSVSIFGPFLDVCLQIALHIHGCCTGREIDMEDEMRVGVEAAEEVLNKSL